jgi:hypothetical protein
MDPYSFLIERNKGLEFSTAVSLQRLWKISLRRTRPAAAQGVVLFASRPPAATNDGS